MKKDFKMLGKKEYLELLLSKKSSEETVTQILLRQKWWFRLVKESVFKKFWILQFREYVKVQVIKENVTFLRPKGEKRHFLSFQIEI